MPPNSKKKKASMAAAFKSRQVRQRINNTINDKEDNEECIEQMENHWTDLSDDEYESGIEECDSDDDLNSFAIFEKLTTRLEDAIHRWNPVGSNCNRGTSRSTFFSRKKAQNDLKVSAERSSKITSFFQKLQEHDDSEDSEDFTEDEMNEPKTSGKSSPMKNIREANLTIQEAIEQLQGDSFKADRSIAKNKKRNILPWQTLQARAVALYLRQIQENVSKMKASSYVANIIYDKSGKWSYKARCIRDWAEAFLMDGKFKSYKQGQHRKTYSIITDENVQINLRAYLRALPDKDRTPLVFMQALNSKQSDGLLNNFENAPDKVSIATAKRWMKYLGWNVEIASKGWFTDGHERTDVVEDRINFLKTMEDIERRSKLYEGHDMNEVILPSLNTGEKEVILITHDESTFYCNEGRRLFWMENGRKKLLPKSKGTSIMVSGFICQCHGFMSNSNGCNSYELFEAGSSRDGWFTNDDLVKQFEKCVPLFKDFHPDTDLYIAFDNSMTHRARAPDGLDSSRLNLKDGSEKVKLQRDTCFMRIKNDGTTERVEQRMQDSQGRQKGIKTILSERGLFKNDEGLPLCLECKSCKEKRFGEARYNPGNKKCCARFVLSQQPDFLAQLPWLQEVVEKHGCHILFYPKYHCELNYIEMVWGWVKSHHRRTCTYNYTDLKANIGNTLLQLLPLSFVRRVARHCLRFMDGYRKGFTGQLLAFCVKKYKSHRRIPDTITNEIAQTMFDEKKNKSK